MLPYKAGIYIHNMNNNRHDLLIFHNKAGVYVHNTKNNWHDLLMIINSAYYKQRHITSVEVRM